MQPKSVVGWDIGGVHIKVALANTTESILQVHQLPCHLWHGLEPLHATIVSVQKKLDFLHSMHAITMTGELVDYFSSRKDGVNKLVEQVENNLQGMNTCYYAGNKGFIRAEKAMHMYKEIASANWLASANFIATQISDALFVDIGSTTSDVVAIKNHKVIFEGYTDAERLYEQELVYCGVVRTPVFALCKSAPVKGKFIPLINECFANVADIYRLTKELPEYADIGKTLDGREKDVVNSARRLARMFGHDAKLEELSIWRQVAEYVREQQLQTIIQACEIKLSKVTNLSNIPIVGAGVGRFLVKDIAQRLNLEYIDFSRFVKNKNTDHEFNVGDCAPAVAVACLAYQRFSL